MCSLDGCVVEDHFLVKKALTSPLLSYVVFHASALIELSPRNPVKSSRDLHKWLGGVSALRSDHWDHLPERYIEVPMLQPDLLHFGIRSEDASIGHVRVYGSRYFD